jgi:hypothetical protein
MKDERVLECTRACPRRAGCVSCRLSVNRRAALVQNRSNIRIAIQRYQWPNGTLLACPRRAGCVSCRLSGNRRAAVVQNRSNIRIAIQRYQWPNGILLACPRRAGCVSCRLSGNRRAALVQNRVPLWVDRARSPENAQQRLLIDQL